MGCLLSARIRKISRAVGAVGVMTTRGFYFPFITKASVSLKVYLSRTDRSHWFLGHCSILVLSLRSAKMQQVLSSTKNEPNIQQREEAPKVSLLTIFKGWKAQVHHCIFGNEMFAMDRAKSIRKYHYKSSDIPHSLLLKRAYQAILYAKHLPRQ